MQLTQAAIYGNRLQRGTKSRKKLQLHGKKVTDKPHPADGYKASSKIFHYQAADEYKHNVNITAFRFTARNKGHVNFGIIIPLCLPISICSTIRMNTTLKTPYIHLFYNIFRPFVSAMLRPFVVGHDGWHKRPGHVVEHRWIHGVWSIVFFRF